MRRRTIANFVYPFVALLATMGSVAPAVAADSYAIRAGRIYTMAAGDVWYIDDATMLVQDGKVMAVGRDLKLPPFIDVIDRSDDVIVPAFVLAHSHLVPQQRGEETVGPQYRAVDAYNSFQDYTKVLAGGVTTVYLSPGEHRLVSGQGGVVKLAGPRAERVLRDAIDLTLNLGERAFDPPNKQNWLIPPSSDNDIKPSDVQRPNSRMGQILELREMFDWARQALPQDDEREAVHAELAALLQRKVPLRLVADRDVDIEQGIAFADDQKHAAVLVGGREAFRQAEMIAEYRVPVIFQFPANPYRLFGNLGANDDALAESLTIPAALHDVPLAIAPPQGAPHRDLLFYLGALRDAGLSERKALAAITSDAARILGVAERVGSLTQGSDADFVILGDQPLAPTARVREVFVGGKQVFGQREETRGGLLVKAGHVWLGDRWVSPGAVYVEDGKIVSAGMTAAAGPYAQVIDAGADAYLTPGFVDAHGHLGLEGEQVAAGTDVSIGSILYHAGPEFARVAEAGVTTVMTRAYRAGNGGARLTAVHTVGATPEELIVRETAGIYFPLRGQKPKDAANRLKGQFKKAKAYDEAWKKYAKELAEYQSKDEDEKKKADAEKKEKEDNVVVEKPKADDITGTWEGEVSGSPLPEPQKFTAKLKHEDGKVEGSFATFFGGGEEIPVSGTYKDKQLNITLDVEGPMGKPRVEATVDKEDHMVGSFMVGRFSIDLEADRTERAVPTIKIKRRRKSKDTEGPQPPPKDESLEPYRELLAGNIAMMLDINDDKAIEAVLPVLKKEYKVPFVLINADEAHKIKDTLANNGVGVILRTEPVREVDKREYYEAADLTAAGISVAYQSNAEDGARHLPLRAAYDTRYGMDPTAALQALTGNAASMLQMDDYVGTLKRGCRGDLLIFDGPPLMPGTALQRVFINGEEVAR